MKIQYLHTGLITGTETFIEVDNYRVLRGVRNTQLIKCFPDPIEFELPNDGRLECFVRGIKGLQDNKIQTTHTFDQYSLYIEGIGDFKWYSHEVPKQWLRLTFLLRYLHLITRYLNHTKTPFYLHDDTSLEEYCELMGPYE